MMVAWSIGCLSFGAASDRIGRRKPLYLGGMIGALVLWSMVVFIPHLPYLILVILLSATGFFAGCFIITFAFAKESVPHQYAGTVSGVSNMGVIVGPMLLQPLIGVILDQHWQGAMADGKRVFDLASYSQGFSMMLMWTVLSLVLLCFTRETYCRQIDQ